MCEKSREDIHCLSGPYEAIAGEAFNQTGFLGCSFRPLNFGIISETKSFAKDMYAATHAYHAIDWPLLNHVSLRKRYYERLSRNQHAL